METLFFIILSTSLISLISFIGALFLFLKEELLNKILLFLVAFSAGALIGGAFLHLLPEAITRAGDDGLLKVFYFTIFGFVIFFILENFIRWHHHHAKEHSDVSPFSYLILISDSLHNFIDGIVIAASFVVAFPLGVVTALAVALHEVPQEIGDFGILAYSGFKKAKALFLNFLSAATIILGGVLGFLFLERMEGSIIFLLSLAAGNFLYIASSDLIPEIKRKTAPGESITHFLVFLLGIFLMFLLKLV